MSKAYHRFCLTDLSGFLKPKSFQSLEGSEREKINVSICLQSIILLNYCHNQFKGKVSLTPGKHRFKLIIFQIETIKVKSIFASFFSPSVNFCEVNRFPIQFSHSVVSDPLRPHELQHARLPCPSPTPRACSKIMSIESVIPYNDLILCCPLLLPPSIFPSIKVFSNESVLRIRWPKYWSFSFSSETGIYPKVFPSDSAGKESA